MNPMHKLFNDLSHKVELSKTLFKLTTGFGVKGLLLFRIYQSFGPQSAETAKEKEISALLDQGEAGLKELKGIISKNLENSPYADVLVGNIDTLMEKLTDFENGVSAEDMRTALEVLNSPAQAFVFKWGPYAQAGPVLQAAGTETLKQVISYTFANEIGSLSAQFGHLFIFSFETEEQVKFIKEHIKNREKSINDLFEDLRRTLGHRDLRLIRAEAFPNWEEKEISIFVITYGKIKFAPVKFIVKDAGVQRTNAERVVRGIKPENEDDILNQGPVLI